jgi:hypothetical protein
MTTLPIQAPRAPFAVTVPSLARVVAAVVLMLDALAEARRMEVAAHKRYPFIAW